MFLVKVKDAKLSQNDIIKIYTELKDSDFSDEDIENFTPLQINASGQTYGPDDLVADLITVTSEEGIQGYVYRDEISRL